MGVKWHYNRSPSKYLNRKGIELRDRVIPVVASRLANSVKSKATKYSPVGVEWVPPRAPSRTPVKSGKLKKSWNKSRIGRWTTRNHYMWKVWTDVEYAPYVEYGTSPHIIRPRNPGGTLVWFSKSGKHAAKMVRHPGTEPVYMLRRAVIETKAATKLLGEPVLRAWANEQRHFYRILRSDV